MGKIMITLKQLGCQTEASCDLCIINAGTFHSIASTGAYALELILRDIIRKKTLEGMEWEVIGQPELHGKIPARIARKKPVRKFQGKMF